MKRLSTNRRKQTSNLEPWAVSVWSEFPNFR